MRCSGHLLPGHLSSLRMYDLMAVCIMRIFSKLRPLSMTTLLAGPLPLTTKSDSCQS